MASSVLVVAIDPDQSEHPALTRALDIAGRQTGAEPTRIHLFACVHTENLAAHSSRRDAKFDLREAARKKLTALAAHYRAEAVSFGIEVSWNERRYEAAVHACARVGADLLLKGAASLHRGPRVFTHESDYYLLRHSPCPVLLVKQGAATPYRRVLAAVAIEGENAEHDHLNNRIIAQARRLARATNAELHVVAALEGSPNLAEILKILEDEDAASRGNEELISARFGVDASCVHVDHGAAKQVIGEVVKHIGAELVVIGTVARKGLSGALVGNTSERVLQEAEADILVVN